MCWDLPKSLSIALFFECLRFLREFSHEFFVSRIFTTLKFIKMSGGMYSTGKSLILEKKIQIFTNVSSFSQTILALLFLMSVTAHFVPDLPVMIIRKSIFHRLLERLRKLSKAIRRWKLMVRIRMMLQIIIVREIKNMFLAVRV